MYALARPGDMRASSTGLADLVSCDVESHQSTLRCCEMVPRQPRGSSECYKKVGTKGDVRHLYDSGLLPSFERYHRVHPGTMYPEEHYIDTSCTLEWD
jgi:hypothetical protein